MPPSCRELDIQAPLVHNRDVLINRLDIINFWMLNHIRVFSDTSGILSDW
jgi:hypothetical protein